MEVGKIEQLTNADTLVMLTELKQKQNKHDKEIRNKALQELSIELDRYLELGCNGDAQTVAEIKDIIKSKIEEGR